MLAQANIQYITDEQGNAISVIIPVNLWREILSERETAYLLKSETMRQRLLDALSRQNGISFEDVHAKLNI